MPPKAPAGPVLPDTDGQASKLVTLRLDVKCTVHESASYVPAPEPDSGAATEQKPARYSHSVSLSVSAPGAVAGFEAETVTAKTLSSPEGAPASLSNTLSLRLQQLALVNEDLVHAIVPQCELGLELTLSRTLVTEDEHGNLQGSSGDPEVIGKAALKFDLADALAGDTSVARSWPRSGVSIPSELSSVCQTIDVNLSTLELEAPADPALAESALAAIAASAKPTPLLPPQVCDSLAPIVLRVDRVEDLPDKPATREVLDTQCYGCRLRMRLPASTSWIEQGSIAGELSWTGIRPPPDPSDPFDPPLDRRTLTFGEPHVILRSEFADLGAFLDTCLREPLLIEVRDRDAKPEVLQLAMPVDDRPPPKPATPEPVPEKPPSGKGKGKGKSEPVPEPEPEPAPEPEEPRFAPECAEYVCGVVRVPMIQLARGLKRLDIEDPVLPLSTIRGVAGLDWRKRPGEYMQAGSTLVGSLRSAKALTECDPAIPPRLFNRAVIFMDHADSGLFHVLEDAVRLHNAVVLGILDPPKPFVELSAEACTAGADHTETAPSATGTHHTAQNATPPSASAPSPNVDTAKANDGRPGAAGARVAFDTGPERSSAQDGAGGAGAGSDEDEDDVPLPAELEAHLDRSDLLDIVTLQSLATARCSEELLADVSNDLVTGFHLTDGKMRMMVVEGLTEGVMNGLMSQVMTWAQLDPAPIDGGLKRKVLYNKAYGYSKRVYGNLGANLWILRLRSTLPALVKSAQTYATGQVRPECKEGLRRVSCLHAMQWARQVHDLRLWPSGDQMKLIDKRFGGELTKADVMGVEANDEEVPTSQDVFRGASTVASSVLDAEGNGATGAAGAAAALTAAGSIVGSEASALSRVSKSSKKRKYGSRVKKEKVKKRYHAQRLPPLDMSNAIYELRKAEHDAIRDSRSLEDMLKAEHGYIERLEEENAGLRETWAKWNPARSMQKILMDKIAAGELSLQDTIRMRRLHFSPPVLKPGCITVEEALAMNWYPHTAPFQWPAAKTREQLIRHPKRPDELRIEQLREPWEEGALTQALALRKKEDGIVEFETACAFLPPALFNKDKNYEKSIFIPEGGEEGLAAQEAAREAAEKQAWLDKVVVDDVTFRTGGPRVMKPSQLDRVSTVLRGPPEKLGFKKTHSPPAPISMFLAEPPSEFDPTTYLLRADYPDKFTAPGVDFRRMLAKEKHSLYKPGLTQSWYGSLHDPHLNDDMIGT